MHNGNKEKLVWLQYHFHLSGLSLWKYANTIMMNHQSTMRFIPIVQPLKNFLISLLWVVTLSLKTLAQSFDSFIDV